MQRIHVSLVAARANDCRGMTIDQPPRNPPTQQPQLPRCTPHPHPCRLQGFYLSYSGEPRRKTSADGGVYFYTTDMPTSPTFCTTHCYAMYPEPEMAPVVSFRLDSIAYSQIMSRNERDKQPTHWTVYRTQHGRHRDVVSLN